MEAGMDKDIPVGKAGRHCCPGEIHGCEYPVGLVAYSFNVGEYRDQAQMLDQLTAKSSRSWSRPAESSATLANKASPDIAACMWAAKRAMAY
jgi:hypothetical protein